MAVRHRGVGVILARLAQELGDEVYPERVIRQRRPAQPLRCCARAELRKLVRLQPRRPYHRVRAEPQITFEIVLHHGRRRKLHDDVRLRRRDALFERSRRLHAERRDSRERPQILARFETPSARELKLAARSNLSHERLADVARRARKKNPRHRKPASFLSAARAAKLEPHIDVRHARVVVRLRNLDKTERAVKLP